MFPERTLFDLVDEGYGVEVQVPGALAFDDVALCDIARKGKVVRCVCVDFRGLRLGFVVRGRWRDLCAAEVRECFGHGVMRCERSR